MRDYEYTRTLIRHFREHPCLWNVFCEDHKNRSKRERARIKIAAALNKTPGEIKLTFRTFTDSFTRALKKQKTLGPGGIKPGTREEFYLRELSFMRDSRLATESVSDGDPDDSYNPVDVHFDEDESRQTYDDEDVGSPETFPITRRIKRSRSSEPELPSEGHSPRKKKGPYPLETFVNLRNSHKRSDQEETYAAGTSTTATDSTGNSQRRPNPEEVFADIQKSQRRPKPEEMFASLVDSYKELVEMSKQPKQSTSSLVQTRNRNFGDYVVSNMDLMTSTVNLWFRQEVTALLHKAEDMTNGTVLQHLLNTNTASGPLPAETSAPNDPENQK